MNFQTSSVLNWHIFDGWIYDGEHVIHPCVKEWEFLDSLLEPLIRYNRAHHKLLEALLIKWDKRLSRWGGEPSYQNWQEFRPLGLAREEEWSDWLQHLLARSQSGDFAGRLFSVLDFLKADYKLPEVEREVLYESYRGDLVITWRNNRYTHLEVKIGDSSLEKTYECSRRLQKKYSVESSLWTNSILLLSSQLAEWEAVQASQEKYFEIIPLTWEEVALALRRSLLFSREDISWKVWALSFLGAIEQKLLMFPVVARKRGVDKIYFTVSSRIDYFRRAIRDER